MFQCFRFFAVTSPIIYSQHRHNTTPAYLTILACWSVSLAIGLPIMAGLNYRPELPYNLTMTNSSRCVLHKPQLVSL